MGSTEVGQDYPCLEVPSYFGLVGVRLLIPTVRYLVRELSSKGCSDLVLQGIGSDPRYGDLGHVL